MFALPFPRSTWLRGTLVALCALLYVPDASAQTTSGPTLKAAFIVALPRFTEWPAEVLPSGAPVTFCVAGDPAMAPALRQAAGGRNVAGHPVVVTMVTAQSKLDTCHVVYISGMSMKQASSIAATTDGLPVVTVSDLDGFAMQGGVANLFYESGGFRYAINLARARKSNLQFSARMLALSRIVGDEASGGSR